MNKASTILELLSKHPLGLSSLQISKELHYRDLEALRVYMSMLLKHGRVKISKKISCDVCAHSAVHYMATTQGLKYLKDRKE